MAARLKTEHIDAIFRRTEDGRVYGATFVDHNSRTVLNGSALDKEYAARAWDEWFKNRPPEPEQTEAPAMTDEPIAKEVPKPTGGPAPYPSHDGEPSLIGQTLLDGLDVFGTLFEPEYESHEYIDPEFRLLHRKKKKTRGPRFYSRPSPGLFAWSPSSLLLVPLSCLILQNLDFSFTFPLATLLYSDCSFRSLSFALSVLSRAAPNSPFPPRPQSYRLSGVSDKAIRSALVGRPCRTPRTILLLVANGEKGKEWAKVLPKPINKRLKFLTDIQIVNLNYK